MKEQIEDILRKVLPKGTVFEVSIPEHAEHGHFSTSVAMRLAKERKKPPLQIAGELALDIERRAGKGFFTKVEAVPPGFINFWISDEAVKEEFIRIAQAENLARSGEGGGKKIIVEYISPNIAKKMHVGHLRNACLGDALANLFAALGYQPIRWNYLGDWGTQFGKLIAAYKLWGKKEDIDRDPIQALLDLYVRFHDELKYRPELEDMGRAEFRKLEEGDKENRALWEWFKALSLKEFDRTFKLLGVKFDVNIGESFYEDKLAGLVKELVRKNLAVRSQGALIVPLDKFGLPPAIIQKADGGSVYHTRDLCNIEYRTSTYKPEQILYVVGNEQALHFEQLFRIAELAGIGEGVKLVHVKYGLVLDEGGKKFATREGRIIFAEEILMKAIKLAREVVEKKNSKLSEKQKKAISEAVGLGALKYANIKENRNSDIVFNWDKILDFSGDSGPYLQYTYSRLRSILRKSKMILPSPKVGAKYLETEEELALVRKMSEMPDAMRIAAGSYAVNHFTNYLYELAVQANKFYESTPILKDKKVGRRKARLLLIATVARVLKEGLTLLGIQTPEKI